MKLRIAGITNESVVDGPGVRYVIFAQGCIHNCAGCHNPETHDIEGGYEIEAEQIVNDILKRPFLNGITFSGGDPFLQAESFAYIASRVRRDDLNIVTYTGFTFEDLEKNNSIGVGRLLGLTDILIDGKFRMAERDISLKFRGSRNQRVIDVVKSIKLGSPVLLYE
jgi:anaerobic ribonucleoside-triphosphate reductase activating protein